MLTTSKKRMREVGKLLEPTATINDLPSEVLKNIFSFVGRGNYYFIGPVSKDFCFNYLTMDVIEDKFAHKMDYQLAIGKNRITTAEAVSTSFDLAEYCFFEAPEIFQRKLLCKAAMNRRCEIVKMGYALGIYEERGMEVKDVEEIVEEIMEKGDLDMLKLILEENRDKPSHFGMFSIKEIMQVATHYNQLEILKWLQETNLTRYGDESFVFLQAARSGHLGILKWAFSVADFNFRDDNALMSEAVHSGNIELVKYLRSIDIQW